MITFVKSLEEVIKGVDLKHILIETDSPYLTPIPHRGKVNQPAFVEYVACKIATIKKIPVETVIIETTKNANTLFNKITN